MNDDLYEKTLKLLNTTQLPFDAIGSSLGVSGRWVRKVRDRQIQDPGVKKIQALHDLLSDNSVNP